MANTSANTLMWFRQDLRLSDNPALSWALEQGSVLPIYVLDESAPDKAQLGGASKWWLHHSLHTLNKSLKGKLLVIKGDASTVIRQFAKQYSVSNVVWNRLYEPWQIARDKELKQQMSEQYCVKSFNGNLLWEPMQVLKKDETPYKVFTPYYRKGCLQRSAPRYPLPSVDETSAFIQADEQVDDGEHITALNLLPEIAWDSDFYNHWTPGELGAKEGLAEFIEQAACSYKDDRNIPSIKGTSHLSPHLHFGEISPHQAWYAIIDNFDNAFDNPDLDCFLSELGWREFSHYLLFHFPTIQEENFNPKFDKFPWRKSAKDLSAWQKGKTGIPIVDAGMRELYQTGYMHNRVRMIVGSFLVKNLLLDWREGERWFWDCLLDADMPANSASWQWVAGSGADAAPYFRVFNPVLQGEKFDKEGEYVKRYCPELSKLPNKYIHKPWDAPDNILKACKIALGKDYPEPIVDLKTSRQRALDAFAQTKDSA